MPPQVSSQSFSHAWGTQESRRSLRGQISACPQAQLARASGTTMGWFLPRPQGALRGCRGRLGLLVR